jgi:hypothetical protein
MRVTCVYSVTPQMKMKRKRSIWSSDYNPACHEVPICFCICDKM